MSPSLLRYCRVSAACVVQVTPGRETGDVGELYGYFVQCCASSVLDSLCGRVGVSTSIPRHVRCTKKSAATRPVLKKHALRFLLMTLSPAIPPARYRRTDQQRISGQVQCYRDGGALGDADLLVGSFHLPGI